MSKTQQDLLAQLKKLDLRLGKDVGATKERAKIALELQKVTPQKEK